jgi:hypothetical protein
MDRDERIVRTLGLGHDLEEPLELPGNVLGRGIARDAEARHTVRRRVTSVEGRGGGGGHIDETLIVDVERLEEAVDLAHLQERHVG